MSPTRRDRDFFTNIAYNRSKDKLDFSGEDSHVGPESCLEAGYALPAHLVDQETTAKVPCLMGSSSRLDSLQMYVFQEDAKKSGPNGEVQYYGRPLKVSE